MDTSERRGGRKPTRVIIRYNTGYKNNLFIRGSGAGLRWDRGVPLKNIGADEWVWETTLPIHDIEFKVLVNDQQYETGENHHIHDGGTVQYTPNFKAA